MGGSLEVRSEAGTGSVFQLTALMGGTDAVPAVPSPLPALEGRTVLLVDDNATNRRILRLQVESWGMVPTDFSTPAAALASVRDGARYDLAVLDMQMPEMNGMDLAAALRECPAGRTVPLVLLTSLGWRPARGGDAEFAAYLTKPVKSLALRDTLATALDQRPQQPWAPPQRSPAPAGAALRILLAEDNTTNQLVGRLMLTRLGHRVDIVSNGLEAVAALHQVPYDVVLMDVQMPELDGLEATRRIRAELDAERQPHIVALTASVAVEDRLACTEAGMDGYLSKPVRAAELSAALRSVLREPAPVTVG